MSEIIDKCCIIDAMCGINTSSPQISRFTDSFDKIRFLLSKELSDYTIMIVTDIDGYTKIIPTDGVTLVKETDESSGKLHLTWNIGSEITSDSGIVIYQIAAYKGPADEPESVWYSKEGRLKVTESIDTTEYSTAVIGSKPNLLTKMILELEGIRDVAKNIAQGKVDKEDGMGLSQNNYDNEAKSKLDSIALGAEVNVQSDWNESDTGSDTFIKNKPNLKSVATTGSYNDLADKPIIDINLTYDELYNNDIKTGGIYRVHLFYDSEYKYDQYTSYLIVTDNNSGAVQVVQTLLNNYESISTRYFGEVNYQTDVWSEWTYYLTPTDISSLGIATKTDVNKALYPTPITGTVSAYKANKTYNHGEASSLSLAFPSAANDGDVIYLTFFSGKTPTNLTIDTTNTSDIELIPEKNTGYEVYAKYNGSIWIANYSEYAVSEG